jgi:hypothetical protein
LFRGGTDRRARIQTENSNCEQDSSRVLADVREIPSGSFQNFKCAVCQVLHRQGARHSCRVCGWRSHSVRYLAQRKLFCCRWPHSQRVTGVQGLATILLYLHWQTGQYLCCYLYGNHDGKVLLSARWGIKRCAELF